MSKDRHKKWAYVRKILVVRPDNLGDVVMSSAAIKSLKEGGGNRHICLLTSEKGARVAQYIPVIDEIMVADLPWAKHEVPLDGQGLGQLVDEVKRRKFDAAVIMTVFSQNPLPSAMICYMAGIPLRLAYCHENPWDLLTDWVPDREPKEFIRHEVQRQLDLVNWVAAGSGNNSLSLEVDPKDWGSLRKKIISAGGVPDAPWIVVHPGASEAKRQYNTTKLGLAVKMIADRWPVQIMFSGIKAEGLIIEEVTKSAGVEAINLAGRLGLGELISLISQAELLISNNTGPVHIASAMKTKVVDLYARTNPQHTPWKTDSEVLYFRVAKKFRHEVITEQKPFGGRQLKGPESIAAAAERLLKRRRLLVDTKYGESVRAYTHI